MPLPFRTLLAAALSSLLLVTLPSGAEGSGPGTKPAASPVTSPGDTGYSRAEARAALHRAQRLMQPPASSRGPRPATADLTMALRDLHLAKPALSRADRRTANRLLSRETAAARTTAGSATGLQRLCSTHFCVHYSSPTRISWVNTTLSTLEHVWAREVPLMHRAPLSDDGSQAPEETNPDDRLDVFLEDLGYQGYYGYCTTEDDNGNTKVSAYCALDDDFAASQFGAPPLNSLRVTAAHEFFHAIQFAADVSEDVWFMEGSATWAEDVVYDTINDNYQYLNNSAITHPRTALDYTGGAYPYGSFIFFSYATAKRGPTAVRRFWDAAVGRPTSLQAIWAVVGGASWPTFMATFDSWNTLPLHSYQERAGYPRPAWWLRRTLTPRATTTGWHSVALAHLGSSAVLLSPAKNLPVRKKLLINIDAPPRASGAAALLQRRYRNGKVTHTMIRLAPNGNGSTLVQFNRKALGSIAIVLANTNRSGLARAFKVRASLR